MSSLVSNGRDEQIVCDLFNLSASHVMHPVCISFHAFVAVTLAATDLLAIAGPA